MRSKSPALLAAILLLSCSEHQPSAPVQGSPPPAPIAPVTSLQELQCTGRVDRREVVCGLPTTNASGDLIIGNQGTFVKLTSSNVAYDVPSSIFSFDVTVQNLIPQTLATVDGTTPDTGAVKVFFHTAPTVTGGAGPISVANPDGRGAFTGTNQDYFKYGTTELGGDGLLATNETSLPKNWQLSIDAGVTSFTFSVYVVAEVRYPNGYVETSVPSPYLNQAATQTMTAVSRTPGGTALPGSTLTFGSSAPAVATVDPSTGQITGVAPGIATITATSSESTTGTVTVQVCPNLAVGEVYSTAGTAGENVCFGGGSAAQEYTMIPTNTATSASVSLSVTGTGIQAVTGPPSPALIPTEGVLAARIGGASTGGPVASLASFASFTGGTGHIGDAESSGIPRDALQRLHARMRTGATPELPAARPHGPSAEETDLAPGAQGVIASNGASQRLRWYPTESAAGTVDVEPTTDRTGLALTTTSSGVPTVGDLVNYNTNGACSGSPSIRTGMVRTVSASAVIVADTANPAGGFTTAQYDSIALEFDSIAYPVVTTNFGASTDLDANGRIVLFFTRAINELSPPASSTVTNAAFYTKDVFSSDPVNGCSNSNGDAGTGAEILYMLVPDPTGAVNSNVRTVSFVRGNVISTSGHELQHLVNAMRRAYVTGASFFETGWMNEALSSATEELMFYRTSGMVPGSNVGPGTNPVSGVQLNAKRVTAYNSYESQQISKLRPWLQRPDTVGLVGSASSTTLARVGFGGTFLRYASDRRAVGDPTFYQSLVNSNLEGLPNLQNAIGGADSFDWIRDFQIALYADDNAAFTVAPQYRTPSWNYRALYALLFGSYSLLPRPLTNNVPLTLAYKAGGSASFIRFGVPATSFAKITTTTPTSTATVRFSWLRTK